MRSTERRPWSFSDIGVRVGLLALAAVLLMALQISGNLRPVQSFITQLTAPAQLSATGVTSSVEGFLTSLARLRTLEQEYAALQTRAEQLEAENNTLREVEQENERLRSLLKFAETRPRLELRGAQIVARVIGEESTNFSETILIDLGAVHGIRTGMPVVTDQGLVGRISEVTENISKVLLLNDVGSSASALLAESRLNGIVHGSASGDLIMDFIPQGPTFTVGEAVLSSGLGGKFPRGLAIGVIESIDSQPNAVFQTARVHPAVDFGSLELVMVITNFEPNESLPDLLLQQSAVTPTPAVAPTEGATP
ncbi:MAG TPA: rod shape-determining protein MreC [Chloroflexi bacterium]|nr:rod shape-determining protein MreC [Chloroflexota bacterium]HHW87353.1 rod shape-determining protein MreC [Chloroflexota bacterium]